ncbi:hypothetical protein AVEN_229649-1 [Araneus ventricosus]|uniref:Uncharacterized protein n=1 Tax=Araneus ventricosus TaxID=182803 RepID=A0A4Y1ZUJ8_ARAVE|nr:hypothetical protein AVEN_229649-1 [Araneus ventricosus]
MVVCSSGIVTSSLSFPEQFNSLSARRLYAFQACLQLFMFSFGEEGVSPRRPKRMSQGNLGVRPESFSAEVHPVTDFPCFVLGSSWHSLHHFST